MANKIYEVLGDGETFQEDCDGCLLILNTKGQDVLDCSYDNMHTIIFGDDDTEVDGTRKTYKKKNIVVDQIGFRELLNCWNEKHGTNY